MPITQGNSPHVKATAFVDYKPAELRINKQWLIVYYAKNPLAQELERFRVTVPALASISERRKHAKKIVLAINAKLERGWLPYYSNSGTNEFKTFEYCYKKFIEHTTAEVQNKTKRPDTLRSYTSHFSMIKKYVAAKQINLNLILEFNQVFVVNFLDWIYFERSNTPRTYNNHLLFIGTFVNYCISRGYLKENFTTVILRKDEREKIRQILSPEIKKKVRLIEHSDFGYFALCMATYFCFIRRTELTKLKVHMIDLRGDYILLSADISKNKKNESVTIPAAYKPILLKLLQNANQDDFVFSENGFMPGKIQLAPKKISDTWAKFRKAYGVPDAFQFYSLKDTGITDLLNLGVPAIKVRDQARHYDLKITEKYTARNRTCDDTVRASNFVF